MSGDDAKLAALRERYPGWSIWKGAHTGSWWAMPPQPHNVLINADDLDRLGTMIADVAQWETGR
jgi:hypothetical protein